MKDSEEQSIEASIKKTKKRIRRLSYVFLVIILIVIVNPVTISMAQHQYDLYQWKQPFLEIPLPPSTTVMESRASIGLSANIIERPDINGDHCFYFAYRQLETELSLEEIEAYYAQYWMPTVNSSDKVGIRVGNYQPQANGKSLVQIQILDIDDAVGYDLRCG